MSGALSTTNKEVMIRFLEFLFSPTYFYADYRKRELRESGSVAKGNLIRAYNTRYLLMAITLCIGVSFIHDDSAYSSEYSRAYSVMVFIIIWLFPLSRANEVCYAFLRDAIAKVNGEKSTSDLKYGERIKLALKSYIELILDFGALFYLLPSCWFKGTFTNLIDSIYFSGVTITTLGYGDISSVHMIPKLLSVYEVLCGFTLIVVSFAIYTGRGLEAKNA